MIQDGKKVKFEYILKVDGEILESTFDGDPVTYTHGSNQILSGLEKGMAGLKVGEEKTIDLRPDDGVGHKDQKAYIEVPKENLPDDGEPSCGDVYALRLKDRKTTEARIVEVKQSSVVLDCNHPLAGKTLQFVVKILEIEP